MHFRNCRYMELDLRSGNPRNSNVTGSLFTNREPPGLVTTISGFERIVLVNPAKLSPSLTIKCRLSKGMPFEAAVARASARSCASGEGKYLCFSGNVHVCVAAGRGRVDGSGDSTKVQPDVRPLLVTKHDDGKGAPSKVLLMADVLVSGEQQVIAGLLSLLNQFTIRELVPPDLTCESDLMRGKTTCYWIGRAIVEKNPHP